MQTENQRRRAREIPDGMADPLMERIRLDCKACPTCGELTLWTGNHQSAMERAVVQIDGTRYAVRRASYQLANSLQEIKPGLCVVSLCEDQCLNPATLKAVMKMTVVKRSIEQGLLHGVLHRDAIKQARRTRGGTKMDMAKARAVRASTLPRAELAAQYGISPQAVSLIVQGRIWAERSNPFARLGARA